VHIEAVQQSVLHEELAERSEHAALKNAEEITICVI
jgi:hypothetical protein